MFTQACNNLKREMVKGSLKWIAFVIDESLSDMATFLKP